VLTARGDCGDTGGDEEAYRFELAKFIHYRIDLLDIRSFGVENGLCVVEDYDHVLRRKEGSQGRQVVGVFNPCTDGPGDFGEEMGARSRELVAADEPTILTKSFPNPVVVEDRECNRCLPNPPCADESNRFEVFGTPDDLLN
jgi:hypothetical protein